MVLFRLLRNICLSVYHKLTAHLQLARLQSRFPNSRIYPGVEAHNVTLEDNTVLFENVIVANTVIGAHSYIQKRATVFNARMGKFCSIAAGVSIGPGRHFMKGVSLHPAFYLKDTPLVKTFAAENVFVPFAQTRIGNDVWIGERAVIIDGVEVGDGAIIAAGAVVTQNVPPYTIMGGVPAKAIRKRFADDEIHQLLQIRWWDYSDALLAAQHNKFMDVRLFLGENWPR